MKRFSPTLTAVVVLTAVALTALATAQTSQSAAAARTLVQRLEARHLEAVAVADPRATGRFIAAMYVPPSQLLVVGARHPNADVVAAAIREGRYRDVYIDLQTTPTIDGKLFVHDIGADGLTQAAHTVVDNAYQNGARAELAKGGQATERFTTIDGEYARMLGVLVGALDALPPPAPALATADLQSGGSPR